MRTLDNPINFKVAFLEGVHWKNLNLQCRLVIIAGEVGVLNVQIQMLRLSHIPLIHNLDLHTHTGQMNNCKNINEKKQSDTHGN